MPTTLSQTQLPANTPTDEFIILCKQLMGMSYAPPHELAYAPPQCVSPAAINKAEPREVNGAPQTVEVDAYIASLINNLVSEVVVISLIRLGAMDTRCNGHPWRNSTCGDTILHLLAVEAALTETVMLELIARGVDLEPTNHMGATPLAIAVHYERLDNVRHLLRAGAQAHKAVIIYKYSTDMGACTNKLNVLGACVTERRRKIEASAPVDSVADIERALTGRTSTGP